MRRMAITVLLGVAVLAAGHARPAAAQTLFFDYVGFDYEDPNPNPAVFGEAGSGYRGLGTVPGLFAPLVADTSLNQYTYFFTGLTPISSSTVGSFAIINYSPGTLSVFEDSKSTGTKADFGTAPPNGVAPATFTDGTLFLTGTLTGFQLVLNTANGSGSFEGAYELTGGSQIVNIPLDQNQGWTFAGTSANALNIPAGYAHQVDGQTFLIGPTPARRSSWGHIKALYR